MTEASAWTVRCGKYGERDQWALVNGLVGGGWHEVPDLTGIETREQMEAVVQSTYGLDKPATVSNYTGQLWALRSRIVVGDLMVTPLKSTSQIAIGVVTGGYEYLANEPDITKRHVLRVDWKRVDTPRTSIKQDLLNTLGSALTVFRSSRSDAAWRLHHVLETGIDKGSRASTALSPVASDDENLQDISNIDLEEYGLNRIQALIQENFANHDLARLVEAILECEGFVCERKPPGPDGGVDILAGKGPLGLESPRLVVQVKSELSKVGDPVVQTLQGAMNRFGADQALLVAWGGVNNGASKQLEMNKFTIRVWTGSDLIRSLLKNYDALPEEIRSELPLKQVWVPVEVSP